MPLDELAPHLGKHAEHGHVVLKMIMINDPNINNKNSNVIDIKNNNQLK